MAASEIPPLVITGFMGSGKTTVGKILATRLGRDFIDMDALIEAEEGMTVAGIFEKRGEAYFREREAECCARLAAREACVISTGGGALVDPANRALFKDAFVVCLDADPEEIFERLKDDGSRPLLNDPDPRRRIADLLASRRSAYAQLRWHVDTRARSAEEVADEIERLLDL
ncbi:MAG TPA: shikimate kinase [Rectinemataceae bacterium]|nr:shikimate kinase [Rectinemataceae bacterium]